MELLEQYRHSVTDDKDYLHGIQTLSSYVHARLKTLLASRFPDTTLDPDEIEITPTWPWPDRLEPLTEFALNHINIAQGTGFKIARRPARPCQTVSTGQPSSNCSSRWRSSATTPPW
jgi:hypothetical protein